MTVTVLCLSSGHVERRDDGSIWWIPRDPVNPPQCLADVDSLCGVTLFHTGPGDPLRDACSWHDHAYGIRAWFEERGWGRGRIDDYFLELMLEIAGDDYALRLRAYEYYCFVRMFGWIFYDRHPAHLSLNKNTECERKCLEICGKMLPSPTQEKLLCQAT